MTSKPIDVLADEELDHLSTLRRIAATRPEPLIVCAVSGSHLYGFSSPDSDVDLRGIHVLPATQILGLDRERDQTRNFIEFVDEVELDLVTHDIEKFVGLMWRKNGLVLEQLFSPLVVTTSPWHEELRALAPRTLTRHHAHHYLGFSRSQFSQVTGAPVPRVKPLLYTYRVLLTGIHLMRTGVVESNLERLQEAFELPYIPDLIAQKRDGPEKGALAGDDLAMHRREVERLVELLEAERDRSALPEAPQGREALDDLVVRLRLSTLQ